MSIENGSECFGFDTIKSDDALHQLVLSLGNGGAIATLVPKCVSQCVESVWLFGNDQTGHNILEGLEAILAEEHQNVADEILGPAADLLRVIFFVCKVVADDYSSDAADLVLDGLETPP
jgi:hypothetical protein